MTKKTGESVAQTGSKGQGTESAEGRGWPIARNVGEEAGIAAVKALAMALREIAATYGPSIVRATIVRAGQLADTWVSGMHPTVTSANMVNRVPPPIGHDLEFDTGYRDGVRATVAKLLAGLEG